jgi:hypothetical protein
MLDREKDIGKQKRKRSMNMKHQLPIAEEKDIVVPS